MLFCAGMTGKECRMPDAPPTPWKMPMPARRSFALPPKAPPASDAAHFSYRCRLPLAAFLQQRQCCRCQRTALYRTVCAGGQPPAPTPSPAPSSSGEGTRRRYSGTRNPPRHLFQLPVNGYLLRRFNGREKQSVLLKPPRNNALSARRNCAAPSCIKVPGCELLSTPHDAKAAQRAPGNHATRVCTRTLCALPQPPRAASSAARQPARFAAPPTRHASRRHFHHSAVPRDKMPALRNVCQKRSPAQNSRHSGEEWLITAAPAAVAARAHAMPRCRQCRQRLYCRRVFASSAVCTPPASLLTYSRRQATARGSSRR